MSITKITEKETATKIKPDFHLLATQTEDVNGTEAVALRRIAAEVFVKGLGLEQNANKVNVLDENATDNQYPSAKAVLDAIEATNPRYGVSGVGLSSPTLTRLWASVGKTATPGTNTVPATSDFDDVAPFNRRKCVGTWSAEGGKAVFTVNAYYGDADYAEDGSMGDYVAIEITPFYWYEDTQNGILGVSEGFHPGWTLHPICLKADGTARAHTYIPAYELALKDGKPVSLPGYHPEFGSYKALWDKCRLYGDGTLADCAILEPSVVDHYNYLLMTIEYATQNMQTVMQGAVSMRYAADCVQADGTDVNSVIVTATTGNAMVEGQSIYIGASYGDSPSAGISTYNVITAIEKCDVDGTLDDAGTYRLITFDGTARTVTGGITQIASRPWLTGSTNKVLGHTGSPVANNNKYPCKYRWLENPYGNINKTCLDLMDVRVEDGDTYKLQWYYNPALMHEGGAKYYPSSTSKPDTADLANEAYGWELLGVETPAESYVNGYIREEGADAKYPCVRVPIKTVGGSSTTYYCDYASLVSSHVVRAVRRRGHLTSGSASGPRAVSAHYAPSDGSWSYGGGLFMAQ